MDATRTIWAQMTQPKPAVSTKPIYSQMQQRQQALPASQEIVYQEQSPLTQPSIFGIPKWALYLVAAAGAVFAMSLITGKKK